MNTSTKINKVRELVASGMPLTEALKQTKLGKSAWYAQKIKRKYKKRASTPTLEIIQPASTNKLIALIGETNEVINGIKQLT